MLNPENVKLAICPIGWTNDDMPDLGGENTFEQCVSEMALAGYTGCEIGGKFPSDPKVLKQALDIRGLQVCNAWTSTYFSVGEYDKTISEFIAQRDKLHYLGAKIIGISEQGDSIQGKPIPALGDQKPVWTDEQWEMVCRGVEELGRLAQEKDMYLAFHHHMGTGVQTSEEIDRFMENTDPNLVHLLFDSGHLTFANIDPVPVLKKYINRTKHVHLKDIRNKVHEKVIPNNWSFLDAVRAGVFTVPGDGDVDFKGIFDILDDANYSGYVCVEAEQDPAKANPFEYALKARKYIHDQAGL